MRSILLVFVLFAASLAYPKVPTSFFKGVKPSLKTQEMSVSPMDEGFKCGHFATECELGTTTVYNISGTKHGYPTSAVMGADSATSFDCAASSRLMASRIHVSLTHTTGTKYTIRFDRIYGMLGPAFYSMIVCTPVQPVNTWFDIATTTCMLMETDLFAEAKSKIGTTESGSMSFTSDSLIMTDTETYAIPRINNDGCEADPPTTPPTQAPSPTKAPINKTLLIVIIAVAAVVVIVVIILIICCCCKKETSNVKQLKVTPAPTPAAAPTAAPAKNVEI